MSVAIITGGASGIGAATVEKLVDENINVAIIDTDREKGQTLEKKYPSQVTYFYADVRDFKTLEESIHKIMNQFKQINYLVTCAGIYLHKTLLETENEAWENVINTNLTGTFYTLKLCLPQLLKNKNSAIIVVSSDQAILTKPASFAYAASKGAVAQMCKSLATDYAEQGLRINSVSPGTIRTPMTESIIKQWAEKDHLEPQALWEIISKEYPGKRIGFAEEVAETIYFLCSEKASFINGANIPVDGGLTAKY